MKINTSSSKEFGEKASSVIIDCAEDRIAKSGKFNLAICGGRMPIPIFNSLKDKYKNDDDLDWSKFNIFWIDDRFVPHDHVDSNYKLFKDHFVQDVKDVNCFPIPYSDDIEECAASYEKIIFEKVDIGANNTPCFDLVLIGVGDDGHIASLFPNSKELQYKGDKRVLTVLDPPFPHKRITFSLDVLNAAKERIIGLKGARKIEIFNEINSNVNNSYPMKFLFDKNSKDYLILCMD